MQQKLDVDLFQLQYKRVFNFEVDDIDDNLVGNNAPAKHKKVNSDALNVTNFRLYSGV
jgi:hypothetical protein